MRDSGIVCSCILNPSVLWFARDPIEGKRRTQGESVTVGWSASGPVVAGVIGQTKFIYDLWATR